MSKEVLFFYSWQKNKFLTTISQQIYVCIKFSSKLVKIVHVHELNNLDRNLVNAVVCLARVTMLGIVRLSLLWSDGERFVSSFTKS